MKFTLPVFALLLLAACSTPAPVPGTVDHQHRLHEEARENFYRLKAERGERTGPAARPRELAREEAPRTARPAPAPLAFQPTPRARPQTSRRAPLDDTIYEPTAEGRAEIEAWERRRAQRFLDFEEREARRLGKTPAQLTRGERAWIRVRAE